MQLLNPLSFVIPALSLQDSRDMQTIADLYKNDVPEDTIFVLEYPTSYQGNFGNPSFLVNSTRYLLDDEFHDHDYESNRLQKPHGNLAVLGAGVRAYVAEPPSPLLVAHWQRKLGDKVKLRYADLGEQAPHVCLFPLQELPVELHAVDPDIHFHIYSKNFIGDIDCPQAAILSEPKLPCVLKVSRSSGGRRVWIIEKEEDYDYWMACIGNTMPYAETVLTELVQEVKYSFCCHLYVNRRGELTWIRVTENIMDEHNNWIGGVVHLAKQEEWESLLRATTEPVVDALHAKGYFGMLGIDVLVDDQGKQFVIDINPRIQGSTPLMLAAPELQKRGWDVGIFLTGVMCKDATTEALISKADEAKNGEMVIYSMVNRDDAIACQIGVFGKTLADCKAIAEAFY